MKQESPGFNRGECQLNEDGPDVVAMAVTDKPPRTVPYVEYDEAPALARRAARA